MKENGDLEVGDVVKVILAIFLAIGLLVVLVMGTLWGFKSFGRGQARANAENQVKISAIQIRNQEQRIKVATQQAEIRHVNAIGIREAQDEIAKTLTPLYVQFEMTQVLLQIAKSGRNNSVVYLPSGANGVPLVANVNTEKVTNP